MSCRWLTLRAAGLTVPTAPRIRIETPTLRHATAFLAAVARSPHVHGGWVSPPATRQAYRRFVTRLQNPALRGHLVLTASGELAGVILITEIVRGLFNSGYLGYYAFAPHDRQGYMRAGLARVIRRAFSEYRLHRLEANIQPANAPSIALVRALGFRQEGYSPRYLKIGGRWRDHERWALTREEWRR